MGQLDIQGVTGKPYNVPKTRRAMPAPFSRNRIDLDGGRRVHRSWQDISILDVKKNDTVAGFGTVAERVEFVNIPGQESLNNPDPANPDWRVRLYNVMGDWQDYPGEQRVFAFVQEPQSVDG